MKRTPSPVAAFTLVEMITVIAIIVILTGLILSVNGLVQAKGASTRAAGEIQQMCSACEAYKNDNGGYPQDPNYTDSLNPVVSTSPATGSYALSSQFLYEQLSGDTQATGQPPVGAKVYASDFFKSSRLSHGTGMSAGAAGYVTAILDPFGNSYGYSTAGLKAEQNYRIALLTDPTTQRQAQSPQQGYNSTFDLWSTGGQTGSTTAKWIKNW